MFEREALIEEFFTFMPQVHKKLCKDFHVSKLTKQQFVFLYFIYLENGKPMSYYGEKLIIPKSNLTTLADKLIDEGFINREYQKDDRRVINLKITEEGKTFLLSQMNIVKKESAKKLDVLNDVEINKLLDLIGEMKKIISKIE